MIAMNAHSLTGPTSRLRIAPFAASISSYAGGSECRRDVRVDLPRRKSEVHQASSSTSTVADPDSVTTTWNAAAYRDGPTGPYLRALTPRHRASTSQLLVLTRMVRRGAACSRPNS